MLLVWIIPIFALVVALRARDRLLLDVSMAAVLATVLTNKSYLGLLQQPWDPIIFGVLVSLMAIMIRRWLLGLRIMNGTVSRHNVC